MRPTTQRALREIKTMHEGGERITPAKVARALGYDISGEISSHIRELETKGMIERVGKRGTQQVSINLLAM